MYGKRGNDVNVSKRKERRGGVETGMKSEGKEISRNGCWDEEKS